MRISLLLRALEFAAIVVIASCLMASETGHGGGLIVEEISTDSPAGKAGLKPGDQILAYDNKPLTSPAAFEALQQNTPGKKELVLQLRRGGQPMERTVPQGTLGIQARPEFSVGVTSQYESGKAALRAGQKKDAVAKWEAAANALKLEGSDAAAAWLYEQAAGINESLRQWKEAIEEHAVAWSLVKGSTDAAAKSRTLVALGSCNQRLNEFPTAERWFTEARDMDVAAGYESWVAADLNSLGTIARVRGDLTLARNNYSQALAIRERLEPNSRAVAAGLNNLGVVAGMGGDLPLAQDYFSRALAIREQLAPNSLDVADSLNDLGIVARRLGDLQAARNYYGRVLAIRGRLEPDSLEVAGTLDNVGLVASDQGELEEAQNYHRRALAIFERLAPDSLDLADSLNNLGVVALARGDIPEAQDYFSRDLAITERLAPDSLDLATSLNNLGLVASDRGDLQAAQDYHSRALAIFKRLAPDTLDVAEGLENMGYVARAKGQFDVAQDYYQQGLAIREQLAPDTLRVAATLDHLGEIARDRGDLQTAQAQHSRASAVFERLAPNSLNFAENLSRLGDLALVRGSFAEARSLFARAVIIVEAQRRGIPSAEARALLVARHRSPYAGLTRAFLGLNDLPAAFATSERARARSLLDLLAESHADVRQGIDPTLLERERSLRQLLNGKARRQTELLSEKHTAEESAAFVKEIDAITIQYDRLRAEIRATSPRYAALTQPQPLTLDEIQRQVLDKGTLLLEYSLGDDVSYLFVVSHDSIKSYELPKSTELESAARQVYERLAARNLHRANESLEQRNSRIARADVEYPKAAQRLSQMLIAPAAAELGSKRLLIVADGALLQIPFGALTDPTSAGGQPLIAIHEVVSLASASVLAAQRRETSDRMPGGRQLALFADPVFERDDPRVKEIASRKQPGQSGSRNPSTQRSASEGNVEVPREFERAAGEAGILDGRLKIRRLPFSRAEADTILALTPRASNLKAVDFDANRKAVTTADLGQYRIVHFATHALINSEHPELSGIVLSLINRQGQKIDGFLRLNEIYNLNLPADLVVLSACQTALGKEIQGEGLIGLTRGFMYAGAARVVASLWKVDDEATAELMGRFYEKMLKRGQPSAAALRQAQVEMSRQDRWRSPYFWAGFAMNGEWK